MVLRQWYYTEYTHISYFFKSSRCPVSGLAPDRAFHVVNNGSQQLPGSRTFEQRTDPFPLWAWEGTSNQFLYIRVFFQLCHGSSGFNQDQVCIEVSCNNGGSDNCYSGWSGIQRQWPAEVDIAGTRYILYFGRLIACGPRIITSLVP